MSNKCPLWVWEGSTKRRKIRLPARRNLSIPDSELGGRRREAEPEPQARPHRAGRRRAGPARPLRWKKSTCHLSSFVWMSRRRGGGERRLLIYLTLYTRTRTWRGLIHRNKSDILWANRALPKSPLSLLADIKTTPPTTGLRLRIVAADSRGASCANGWTDRDGLGCSWKARGRIHHERWTQAGSLCQPMRSSLSTASCFSRTSQTRYIQRMDINKKRIPVSGSLVLVLGTKVIRMGTYAAWWSAQKRDLSTQSSCQALLLDISLLTGLSWEP